MRGSVDIYVNKKIRKFIYLNHIKQRLDTGNAWAI